MGLIVSGAFFIFLVLKTGPKKFREEIISTSGTRFKLGRGFDFLVKFILPVQLIAMLGWWFWDSYSNDPANWYKIFSQSTLGTVLFQWTVAIVVFLAFNKIISKKLSKKNENWSFCFYDPCFWALFRGVHPVHIFIRQRKQTLKKAQKISIFAYLLVTWLMNESRLLQIKKFHSLEIQLFEFYHQSSLEF